MFPRADCVEKEEEVKPVEEVKVVEKSAFGEVVMCRKKRGFPWLMAVFIVVVAVVLYRYYDLVEPLYNQLLAKLSLSVCWSIRSQDGRALITTICSLDQQPYSLSITILFHPQTSFQNKHLRSR